MEKSYIAIDLKSFYASVECRERNLDPLTTNLVVADASRTEKTIGLAVSPSLKSFGIGSSSDAMTSQMPFLRSSATTIRRSIVVFPIPLAG